MNNFFNKHSQEFNMQQVTLDIHKILSVHSFIVIYSFKASPNVFLGGCHGNTTSQFFLIVGKC